MIKAIIIGFILYSNIVCAQQITDSIFKGKNYYYFTSAGLDLKKMPKIDSLVKAIHSKGFIEVIEGGDYDYRSDYKMYYLNDDTLEYYSSTSHDKLPLKNESIAKLLNDPASFADKENIGYLYTEHYSSGSLSFIFLSVLHGEVISSFFSNVPLSKITDENVKEKMKLFFSVFQ